MKILWAVDPFAKDKSFQRSSAWAVRSLAKSPDHAAWVEPVYCREVASLDPVLELAPDLSAELTQETRTAAEEEMGDITRRIRIPGLQPVQVLLIPSGNLRRTAQTLIDYAKRVKADVIVVSTRARKGVSRWIMGSFAETLLLYSDVPLFVVNPKWDRAVDLKHILFPTDFSEESHKAYQQVIQFAKPRRSEITIFHKVGYELTPGLDVAFSAYAAYREYYEQDVQAREEQGEAWADEARKVGLKANAVLDTALGGSASETILKMAKKRDGIIAMAAQSGAVSASLTGSTARQIVRLASLPLWIIHPNPKVASRKQAGRKAA